MQEHKESGTISSLKSAKLLSISANQGLDSLEEINRLSTSTITRCSSMQPFNDLYRANSDFQQNTNNHQVDVNDQSDSEADTPPSTPLTYRRDTATYMLEENFANQLNFNDTHPTVTKLS